MASARYIVLSSNDATVYRAGWRVVVALAIALTSTARAQVPSGESPAALRARTDSARLPWTAADVHFMSAMIGHHTQAIAMAEWAPTHGASASIQRLAERIINAQHDEITIMQRWLRDRRQPVPDTMHASVTGMEGMHHDELMPGMLTPQQMQALDSARGAAFDKLFLASMIQHHRGAVTMVQELFNTYGAAQDETVFKFASDVNVDQSTEIVRMQKLLASITLGIPIE